MQFDIQQPSRKRITVAPAGRGWKARPEINVTPDYVRKLLEENRLTERDEALLRLLDGLAVVSSRQIKRLYWPDSTMSNMHRRLRQLYDYHLLDRVRMLSKEEGITYCLGKAGRIWLHGAARGGSPPVVNLNTLAHDLAISEVLVLMTEDLRRADPDGQRGLRLEWTGETGARIAHGERTLVEPDGLLGISVGQVSWRVYLEMDMGTERGDRFKAKLQRYERAWQQVLRKDAAAVKTVLVIAPSPDRAANLAEVIKPFTAGEKTAGLLYLVGALPSIQKRGFFVGARWYVVAGGEVTPGKWPAPWDQSQAGS